jgi:hypothetical protein
VVLSQLVGQKLPDLDQLSLQLDRTLCQSVYLLEIPRDILSADVIDRDFMKLLQKKRRCKNHGSIDWFHS